MCFDASHYRALNCGQRSFNPHFPRGLWEMEAEPLTLALELSTDISSRHVPAIVRARPTVFLTGLVLLLRFSTVWLPMKAEDCNIWRGATPSSVKSSDCVTNFPVQGGIAADCIPLSPGCGSLGRHRTSSGNWWVGVLWWGSHKPDLERGFVRGKIPDSEAKVFTWQKQLFVYVPFLCTDWPQWECYESQ